MASETKGTEDGDGDGDIQTRTMPELVTTMLAGGPTTDVHGSLDALCAYVLHTAPDDAENTRALLALASFVAREAQRSYTNDEVRRVLVALPLETSSLLVDTLWLFLACTFGGYLIDPGVRDHPLVYKTVELAHKRAAVPAILHGCVCLLWVRLRPPMALQETLVYCHTAVKCQILHRGGEYPPLAEVLDHIPPSPLKDLARTWCADSAPAYHKAVAETFVFAYRAFGNFLDWRRARETQDYMVAQAVSALVDYGAGGAIAPADVFSSAPFATMVERAMGYESR